MRAKGRRTHYSVSESGLKEKTMPFCGKKSQPTKIHVAVSKKTGRGKSKKGLHREDFSETGKARTAGSRQKKKKRTRREGNTQEYLRAVIIRTAKGVGGQSMEGGGTCIRTTEPGAGGGKVTGTIRLGTKIVFAKTLMTGGEGMKNHERTTNSASETLMARKAFSPCLRRETASKEEGTQNFGPERRPQGDRLKYFRGRRRFRRRRNSGETGGGGHHSSTRGEKGGAVRREEHS